MPSSRTFYRTLIIVEVLSEDPYNYTDLANLASDITTGNCSGEVSVTKENDPMDGPTAARALQAQGSDPEFFQLTEDGEDIDE